MPRILLIEDDELLRRMLRISLTQRGHIVFEVRDGKEGLALHDCEPVDLVLTDIVMPGKEGLETIMELRRKDPAAKIIAMSGGGRVAALDYLRLAEKLGAARVLAKPFSTDELAAAIDAVVDAGAPQR